VDGERRPVRASLLRNDGEGRFTDVAVEAGRPQRRRPHPGGGVGRLDNDGWLDLFVGREADDDSVISATLPSSLYINRGDGTFVDVALHAGVASPAS
jgi:hypothetical protein